MNDSADDELAILKKVAEDPLVAPSRRVRARKALKLIEARVEKGAGQMSRSAIIDLIAAAADGAG